MIDRKQATELAEKTVEAIGENANVQLAILLTETLEFEYGWMFFYQSKKYVEIGDYGAMVGGNAPIIVDKVNASVHFTGTGFDEDYYLKKYCELRDNPHRFQEEIRKGYD